MGSLFEVDSFGRLKAQGFLIPLQDFGLYTPSIIVVPSLGIDSVSSDFACYTRIGRIVTITNKFSINVSAGGINPVINTPIFSFTVPFGISEDFKGESDNYPIGSSSQIYKDGQNLSHIGTVIARTSTLPSQSVNILIRNQNPAVMIQANNPFSLNFEFTYLCVEE